MPRSSGGVMSLTPSDVAPAVSNTVIDPVTFNAMLTDIATELTNSLDRGGRGAVTAALSMGGFKLQNLGAPAVAADAVNLSYLVSHVQTGSMVLGAVAGTSDVITATFTPTQTALTNGMTALLRFGAANATTTPSLNIDILGANTIFKGMGVALGIGDIPGAGFWGFLIYDSAFNAGAGGWCLLNPVFALPVGMPLGRLTALTATPVMSASVSGATSIYWTPYLGNQFPGFNAGGTIVSMVTLAELSQALTDGTKSPSAAAINSNYDMFVWLDGSTWRCTRGPVWTNATTRSAGTALVVSQGLLVNSLAITNGPGVGAGVYVGTIRTNAAATVDYIFGGSGVAASFGVWNMFNRKLTATQVQDSTASWTYSSVTVRQVRASAINQASFVTGLPEDAVQATYQSASFSGASGNQGIIGLGLDSITAFTGIKSLGDPFASSVATSAIAMMPPQLLTGFHTIAALEATFIAGVITFYGTGYSGLTASLMN
jgi:hypothetical protein